MEFVATAVGFISQWHFLSTTVDDIEKMVYARVFGSTAVGDLDPSIQSIKLGLRGILATLYACRVLVCLVETDTVLHRYVHMSI